MSDKVKYPVITISREYAAGGRTIARMLSEQLGIPWYDNDFVKKAAEESGISEEEILKTGEEISRGSAFLNSFLNNLSSIPCAYDALYEVQKSIILKLALKEPCILVGRCSNYILQEANIQALHVYLYAQMKDRLKRAVALSENADVDIVHYVEARDTLRNNYYRHYTGKNLGSAEDFNLSLDTGFLGYDGCVAIIRQAVESINNRK